MSLFSVHHNIPPMEFNDVHSMYARYLMLHAQLAFRTWESWKSHGLSDCGFDRLPLSSGDNVQPDRQHKEKGIACIGGNCISGCEVLGSDQPGNPAAHRWPLPHLWHTFHPAVSLERAHKRARRHRLGPVGLTERPAQHAHAAASVK